MKLSLSLAGTLALSISHFAFSDESITTGRIEVYSATPLPSIGLPMDMVPSSIQTVSQKQLSQQNGVSIADYMVNNLEGVTVNEIAGNPFQLEINYRGYNATPIAGNPQGLSVYVDGVRVNEPFSNVVMWDLIPDFAMENMQLVGGSNPVYGLNTLGGAISIQTKSGRTFNKNAVDFTTGSWGRNVTLLESGGVSQDGQFDYYMGYQYFEEDGWRDYSPSYVNQLFTKVGWETETSRYDLSYTGSHNLLIGNGLTPKDLLGSDMEGIHTLEDETINNFGRFVLSGTEFINDKTMLASNLYYGRSDRKTYNGDLNGEYCSSAMIVAGDCLDEALDTNEGVLNRTGTKQDAYGANTQVTFDQDWLGKKNQLIVGAGLEYSLIKFRQSEQEIATLEASGFFSGETEDEAQTTGLTGKTKTFGLFATNTHSLSDKWSLNTAARYNFIQVDNIDTYNAEGSDTSLTGKHHYERINPSLGLTFHPNDNYTTYVSYSESNRAPTSIELGCSNPDQPCNLPTQMADDPPLDQVVAKTFEVGARGKITNNFRWNASIYNATNYDDILFVFADASNGMGYFTNVDKTTRQGVDTGISGRFDSLSFNVSYGYVRAQYGSDLTMANEVNSSSDGTSITVKDGDYLPNIPKHQLKVRTNYEVTPKWSIGSTLTAFSSSYMAGNENQGNDSSVNGLQSEVPGYAIVNLDSDYSINKQWNLSFKAINIFDNEYYTGGRLAETNVQSDRTFDDDQRAVASMLPGAPRAAWVSLRYEF